MRTARRSISRTRNTCVRELTTRTPERPQAPLTISSALLRCGRNSTNTYALHNFNAWFYDNVDEHSCAISLAMCNYSFYGHWFLLNALISCTCCNRGPGSSSGKALNYVLDGPGAYSGSRLVLGSTQPPGNEYRGFPHLFLVPWLRICGPLHPDADLEIFDEGGIDYPMGIQRTLGHTKIVAN